MLKSITTALALIFALPVSAEDVDGKAVEYDVAVNVHYDMLAKRFGEPTYCETSNKKTDPGSPAVDCTDEIPLDDVSMAHFTSVVYYRGGCVHQGLMSLNVSQEYPEPTKWYTSYRSSWHFSADSQLGVTQAHAELFGLDACQQGQHTPAEDSSAGRVKNGQYDYFVSQLGRPERCGSMLDIWSLGEYYRSRGMTDILCLNDIPLEFVSRSFTHASIFYEGDCIRSVHMSLWLHQELSSYPEKSRHRTYGADWIGGVRYTGDSDISAMAALVGGVACETD